MRRGEVLAFNTLQLTDHHWRPRLLLFLPKQAYLADITPALSQELLHSFDDLSTNSGESDEISEGCVEKIKDEPIHRRGEFSTLQSFFQEDLEVDADAEVTVLDWLILPEQELLSLIIRA